MGRRRRKRRKVRANSDNDQVQQGSIRTPRTVDSNRSTSRRSPSRSQRIDISETIALYGAYMPGRFFRLHYKFIRFCTNLFNQRTRWKGATPAVLAPKHGEEEVEELGKNNGNPTNTEGSPRGIPISKVLHEIRHPPIRRCKMGDPGRSNNRSQGTGHLRAEEHRSFLVLVPDSGKHCRIEIFPRETRDPGKRK